MNKFIIGVDIDGVLRNFTKGLSDTFLKKYPQFKEENLQIADTWDFFIKYPWKEIDSSIKTEEDIKNIALDFVFNSGAKSIFENSPIYENTIESIEKLKKFSKDNNFDVRIISHQTSTTKMYTLNWLAKYELDFEQYYFVDEHSRKWEYCDVMIDDSPIVLNSKPNNKYSIKINHLYNTNVKSNFELNKFSEIDNAFEFLYKINKS